MPSFPRDYDPQGREPYRINIRTPLPEIKMKRLPSIEDVDRENRNKPFDLKLSPVFGRKVTPPTGEVALPEICPHECRMIDYGGCDGPCRLMARN